MLLVSLVGVVSAQTNLPSESWIEDYNHGRDLSGYFTPRCGTAFHTDFTCDSGAVKAQIQRFRAEYGEIVSLRVKGSTRGKDGHFMQTGIFRTSSGKQKKHAFIWAWRKTPEGYIQEVAYVFPGRRNTKAGMHLIDHQRDKWEDYSNGHDPEGLITQVYTSDACYFNGGRLFRGQNEIIKRYAYMKRDTWSISLTANTVWRSDKDRILEIGTYQSTGDGQYMIIWERQDDGSWGIAFDFNF